MAAFFTNINARLKACGSIYFLLAPLGGLVVYTVLFNVTKSSPLVLVGVVELFVSIFTAIFVAFALAFLITLAFSLVAMWGGRIGEQVARFGTLAVFAAASTLFALIAAENFAYTVARVGIKTTDGVFAKTLILAVAGGLFWLFWSKGEAFRALTRSVNLSGVNIMLALSVLAAGYNLSGNIRAQASADLAIKNDANVIILSADGIDAKRTSVYGYERGTTPFLEFVADEFLIARKAYPNNGNTTGAITSLLTGMLPTRTKVVFPPDSLKGKNALRSLPRLLRNAGYYTNNIAVPHYADASEQNMLGAFDLNNNRAMFSSSVPVAFNYKTTNWLLDRIVAETAGIARDVLWLGEMPNPYTQVDGLKRGYNYGNNDIKRLQNLLGTIRNKSEPFFINSHFLGPHGPFFNPPLRHFASATANRGEPWQKDLYDDAILSFDMYVKRVYTALKEQGLLERTVLVIMSDHGIGHDPRKQVPMMMRFPNAAHGGQAIEENVQVIDVTATLIDYLGGKKPAWMQGDSLIGGSLPADRKIFSAGVKKIAFVPGVGVVGNEHGRYGTMDYFFMVHCGSQYRLDVDDGSFEVTRDDEGAQPCTPDQVFDEAAAKAAMREHLSAHY